MANRRRLPCFVCNATLMAPQMARIDRNEDVRKREIAILRRDAANRDPLEVTEQTRLCNNCNISILNEIRLIEQDPFCLRLNVLTQTSSNTCLICNGNNNLTRLTAKSRVHVYLKKDIYVSKNTKCCPQHLDDKGYILEPLLQALRYVNRPYVLKGDELKHFLEELRNVANNVSTSKYDNENNFNDAEFSSFSPITKEQFRDLFTFCDPVYQERGFLYVTKRHLLTFLCKMRQGLSDDFLTVIFGYKSRQRTSTVIATVRKSLNQRFTPENVGINAITRDNFIERHVTEFTNQLYNPEPDIPRAIVYIDGTYITVEKSSNFQAQRLSYSTHKGYHLLKPALIVAPDGYILDIHGPYFSDSHNNDAAMLTNEFQRETTEFREWFQENDILVLDRGYRDAAPLLEQLGIIINIPAFLQRNQKQFTTEEANSSRLITKTRWIVEARNGHLKSIFKFFAQTISVTHAINLGDFLKIAAAIINRYKEPIHMENAEAELANELMERARQPNVMQARVEVENLKTRNGRWVRLNHHHVNGFPHLPLDYLKDVTVGVYQIHLAPAYIQDTMQRDETRVLQFDELIDEPGLLRVRVYSRFKNAVKHQLWIAYRNMMMDVNEDNEDDADSPILSYYCTCKAGARTLGTCAHVASVLWFLGYTRYENNIKYPSTALLRSVEDAANRI